MQLEEEVEDKFELNISITNPEKVGEFHYISTFSSFCENDTYYDEPCINVVVKINGFLILSMPAASLFLVPLLPFSEVRVKGVPISM